MSSMCELKIFSNSFGPRISFGNTVRDPFFFALIFRLTWIPFSFLFEACIYNIFYIFSCQFLCRRSNTTYSPYTHTYTEKEEKRVAREIFSTVSQYFHCLILIHDHFFPVCFRIVNKIDTMLQLEFSTFPKHISHYRRHF